VTKGTSPLASKRYLHCIKSSDSNANKGAKHMSKFLCLAAALVLFAPVAMAALNQAALIVA
jgi:hypothetical protein